jgi:hypothetical protein
MKPFLSCTILLTWLSGRPPVMEKLLNVWADKFNIEQNNITNEYFNRVNDAENTIEEFSYLGIINAAPQPYDSSPMQYIESQYK